MYQSLSLLAPLLILVMPAVITFLPISSASEGGAVTRHHFEYKYSFKGPHLVQSDLTVPFWTLLGDVVAGDDQIRLVPSIRDKKGLAWSKYAFPYQNWEVEVHIRVEGRGNVGADGMAIWYTSESGELGPVYGAKDYWNGIGVFLDSFDNDNKMDNPLISVVVNDGSLQYEHANDGADQHSGSCRLQFRNKPYPVKLRLQYFQQNLTVSYSSGNLPDDDFVPCTVVERLDLPVNYYFGISAATGGLADDHDVLKFLTWSIKKEAAEQNEDGRLQEDEQKALMDDYEKNLEDFNKMREEYKKQNPGTHQDQQRPEDLYEGVASQELRSVFEIQSAIKKEIRSISNMLGHMLERQSSVLARLDSGELQISAGGASPAGADDNAKKYHVDNILNMQRETYDSVKLMRESIYRVEQVVNNIDLRVRQQAETRPGAQNSYEEIEQRRAITDKLRGLQNDLSVLLQRQPTVQQSRCPEPDMPSCVSLKVFVAVAILQVVLLLLYHTTRTSREEAAKKYF